MVEGTGVEQKIVEVMPEKKAVIVLPMVVVVDALWKVAIQLLFHVLISVKFTGTC
jgi:hypothetical protein